MNKKSIKPENALSRLADLCARSEQCSYEVSEKLKKWGISTTDRSRILKTLKEGRYIDDFRYAAAYAADKLRFSGWGKRKIALMLRAKRIPAEHIQQVISNIDPDEYLQHAVTLLKTRCHGTSTLKSREETIKIVRFGMQRGFEYDILVKALKSIEKHAQNS